MEVESGRGNEAWRAAEMCEEKRPSKMNTTRESDDETEMRTADLEAEVVVTCMERVERRNGQGRIRQVRRLRCDVSSGWEDAWVSTCAGRDDWNVGRPWRGGLVLEA